VRVDARVLTCVVHGRVCVRGVAIDVELVKIRDLLTTEQAQRRDQQLRATESDVKARGSAREQA
jgi:hypothetical protein